MAYARLTGVLFGTNAAKFGLFGLGEPADKLFVCVEFAHVVAMSNQFVNKAAQVFAFVAKGVTIGETRQKPNPETPRSVRVLLVQRDKPTLACVIIAQPSNTVVFVLVCLVREGFVGLCSFDYFLHGRMLQGFAR
jgi:hypothetical protein